MLQDLRYMFWEVFCIEKGNYEYTCKIYQLRRLSTRVTSQVHKNS